ARGGVSARCPEPVRIVGRAGDDGDRFPARVLFEVSPVPALVSALRAGSVSGSSLRIADCGLRIADRREPAISIGNFNPQSAFRNPQSEGGGFVRFPLSLT